MMTSKRASASLGLAAMVCVWDAVALSAFDPAWPQQVAVVQARLVDVSPVSVDFGPIKVGKTITVPVTIKNLTASALTVAGGGFNNPGAFGGNAGNCGGSNAVPAGGSCSMNYTFRPTAADQTFTAATSISVGANGVGSTSQALNFSGSGTESLAQVSPVAIDFGTSQIGATVTLPITFTNTHSATVNLAGGGGTTPPFGGNGGDCNGGILPAATNCHFNYTFTPSAIAPAQGSTGVGISGGTGLYQSQSFAFSGGGATSAGIVTFNPASIDFGAIKLGRTVSFEFIATNISASTVNFAGGGFNDNAGGAFGGSTTCGGGLASGAQCKFTYRFQPRVLGAVSASTSVGASAGGQGQSFPVHVTGTGIGTLAQVTPTTIDFGQIQTGTYMDVPVVVTNTSESPLTGFLGGSVNWPFSATNGCPTNLAVGASCTISYRFHPSSDVLGLRSTQTILSFTNATGVRPNITITLNGTGYDADKIFLGDFE